MGVNLEKMRKKKKRFSIVMRATKEHLIAESPGPSFTIQPTSLAREVKVSIEGLKLIPM